jgi:hypothetical protein
LGGLAPKRDHTGKELHAADDGWITTGEPRPLGLLGVFDPLEFFAGLEANGFARGDVDFFAGARIAADTGLARLDAEDAEAPELDTLAAAESLLERFENRFDSLLGFSAADESLGDNRIHDVQLDHKRLLLKWQMLEGEAQVVKTRWVNYTDALSRS